MSDILTPHLNLVPFVRCNDGNRLQMSASQLRQGISLVNREIPKVVTGFEKYLLISKSTVKGKVIYADNNLISILTENGEEKIVYLSMYDIPVVKTGDTVEEGDILCLPEGFYLGNLHDNSYSLAFGVNLFCGIMSHPLSYEDAYVISSESSYKFEGFVIRSFSILIPEGFFLEPNYLGKIFPEKGDIYPAKKPILVKRNLNNLLEEEEFFDYPIEIKDVRVIVNEKIDLTLPSTFRGELAKLYNQNLEDYYKLINYPRTASAFANVRGIHAKFFQNKKNWVCYIYIIYKEIHVKVNYGDKISNRHAGKGVLSKIKENVPIVYPENKKIEIILNPMSIISRMNIGTLYEILANKVLYFFTRNLEKINDLEEAKNYILEFYDRIDLSKERRVKNSTEKFLSKINSLDELKKVQWLFTVDNSIEANYYPLLEELAWKYVSPQYIILDLMVYYDHDKNYYFPLTDKDKKEDIITNLENTFCITKEEAEEWLKKNRVYRLHPTMSIAFDPEKSSYFFIYAGYLYCSRLIHLASYKLTARSTGKVSRSTLQPIKVAKDTGQRIGEMESLAIISYDVLSFLNSVMTTCSDEMVSKVKKILSLLFNVNVGRSRNIPAIQHLLKSYFKVLGLEL